MCSYDQFELALASLGATGEGVRVRREVANTIVAAGRLPAYLPDAGEKRRAAPNAVLRSALFAALPKGSRPRLNKTTLASLGGVEVIFSGERLDQGDLDLYLTLLRIATPTVLGSVFDCSSHKLLHSLDVDNGGRSHADLEASLHRLRAGTVTLKQGGARFIGGLVEMAARPDKDAPWRIRLSPELAPLFTPDSWTGLDWTVRQSLRGKPLAQWLHGYFSSHANAHPISIALLRDLSGSQAKELSKFKQNLQRALAAIETACLTQGAQFTWQVKNNLVVIARGPP